jgi:hypothetical protein
VPAGIEGHVRGALNNGCTVEEIREALLHCAVYAGVPAAIDAFRAAQEVIDTYQKPKDRSFGSSYRRTHSNVGAAAGAIFDRRSTRPTATERSRYWW